MLHAGWETNSRRGPYRYAVPFSGLSGGCALSGLLAGKVWLSDLPPELKPIAATLADIADDDGSRIFPSIAYVAWRLSRTRRSVDDGLAALRDLGVLHVVSQGGGRERVTEYRMLEDMFPKRESWTQFRNNAKVACFTETAQSMQETTQSTTETTQPTTYDSLLPVIDPSSVMGQFLAGKQRNKDRKAGRKHGFPKSNTSEPRRDYAAEQRERKTDKQRQIDTENAGVAERLQAHRRTRGLV